MKSERKQEIFPVSFRSEYELVFVHLRPELGDDWVGPSDRKKRKEHGEREKKGWLGGLGCPAFGPARLVRPGGLLPLFFLVHFLFFFCVAKYFKKDSKNFRKF